MTTTVQSSIQSIQSTKSWQQLIKEREFGEIVSRVKASVSDFFATCKYATADKMVGILSENWGLKLAPRVVLVREFINSVPDAKCLPFVLNSLLVDWTAKHTFTQAFEQKHTQSRGKLISNLIQFLPKDISIEAVIKQLKQASQQFSQFKNKDESIAVADHCEHKISINLETLRLVDAYLAEKPSSEEQKILPKALEVILDSDDLNLLKNVIHLIGKFPDNQRDVFVQQIKSLIPTTFSLKARTAVMQAFCEIKSSDTKGVLVALKKQMNADIDEEKMLTLIRHVDRISELYVDQLEEVLSFSIPFLLELDVAVDHLKMVIDSILRSPQEKRTSILDRLNFIFENYPKRLEEVLSFSIPFLLELDVAVDDFQTVIEFILNVKTTAARKSVRDSMLKILIHQTIEQRGLLILMINNIITFQQEMVMEYLAFGVQFLNQFDVLEGMEFAQTTIQGYTNHCNEDQEVYGVDYSGVAAIALPLLHKDLNSDKTSRVIYFLSNFAESERKGVRDALLECIPRNTFSENKDHIIALIVSMRVQNKKAVLDYFVSQTPYYKDTLAMSLLIKYVYKVFEEHQDNEEAVILALPLLKSTMEEKDTNSLIDSVVAMHKKHSTDDVRVMISIISLELNLTKKKALMNALVDLDEGQLSGVISSIKGILTHSVPIVKTMALEKSIKIAEKSKIPQSKE